MANPLSPFHGWPRTRQYRARDGALAFRMVADALTPLRAKLADGGAVLSAIGLFAGGMKVVTEIPNPGWLVAAAIAAPFAACPVLKAIYRSLLRKPTILHITTGLVQVQSLLGMRTFNRELRHRFSMVPHDKTRIEQEKNDLKVRRAAQGGRVIGAKTYYGQSYHLSFDYLDQRNDLLTVFGQKDALGILTRLKAIDDVLEAELRRGDGESLDPRTQWKERPGEIPQ